jgi:hypothetical protein
MGSNDWCCPSCGQHTLWKLELGNCEQVGFLCYKCKWEKTIPIGEVMNLLATKFELVKVGTCGECANFHSIGCYHGKLWEAESDEATYCKGFQRKVQ